MGKPAVTGDEWFEVDGVVRIASPAILIYRERVEENLSRMVAMAGEAQKLRPHIKSHKMREMIELQLALGITKFKCATIAEAEMAAEAGVADLMLAYQPVGPAVGRVMELIRSFPATKFSVICDDEGAIRDLGEKNHRWPQIDTNEKAKGARALPLPIGWGEGQGEGNEIEVLLDIDLGYHRTGVPAGAKAVELYRLIDSLPGLRAGGLHAYDGHITNTDPATRAAECEAAFAPVAALKRDLVQAGLPVPRVVAGGTPTFPFHAKRPEVECSPGTCVFWDASYLKKFPDLKFLPAALVLTRVVSKPGTNRLCLDLGHKAIASEMPHPRVDFLNLTDAKAVTHSEEHLVIETAQAGEFDVGDCLYGLPWHVCPTVALHSAAVVIEQGKVVGEWKVAARERRITI
jgi:D-serine deaminase-like pyridoxal phosphate-dependent protein